MAQRNILFLSLSTFSSTGGIEKFNRAFLLALLQIAAQKNTAVTGWGLYDSDVNEKYISSKQYRFFTGKRIHFVISAIKASLKTDVLVLGHINLAVVGVVAKILKPRIQLLVICHGIDVFDVLKGFKLKLLHKANLLLAVSSFTKQKLQDVQKVPSQKIIVFPNTIDPFFNLPRQFQKPVYLKERYQISDEDKVLFTVTRLNSNEGYKGYDKIINALPALLKTGMKIKYILGGKADAAEQERISKQIQNLGLQKHVLLAGFIANEELTDHYLLADVFAMPSKGEGFGIVFLEAMACGLSVVAGNKDGSTEPLRNGELGWLLDPDDLNNIEAVLHEALLDTKDENQKKQLQQKVTGFFGFEQYKNRLETIPNLF